MLLHNGQELSSIPLGFFPPRALFYSLNRCGWSVWRPKIAPQTTSMNPQNHTIMASKRIAIQQSGQTHFANDQITTCAEVP